MEVVINDALCISSEYKQYRFPKHKSRRKTKKWAKNKKNYRFEDTHKCVKVGNRIFVSSKTFKQLQITLSRD